MTDNVRGSALSPLAKAAAGNTLTIVDVPNVPGGTKKIDVEDINPNIEITAEEIAASVTPTNLLFDPGDPRRQGVTFDGVTDDQAAWQRTLDVKGHILPVAGSTVVGAQLVIKSNTLLELDPECIMRRSWAGTNGQRPENATIKNENAPTSAQITVDPGPLVPSTFDTDIRISGGQWGHLDDDPVTYRGTHIALIAVRGGSLQTTFKTQRSEWCTVLWIEDFDIPWLQFNVAEGGANVSNDALHIIAWKNVTVGRVNGGSDDDLVVLGSNTNLAGDGITIDSINGNSNSNALRIVQSRNGVTAGFGDPTEELKNISVGKIAGDFAAKRSGICYLDITGHSVTNLFKNISVGQVNVNFSGTVDGSNVFPFRFEAGVGVHLGICEVTGTPIRDIIQASDVVGLTFERLDSPAPTKSGERIADLTNITGFKFGGGNVACNAQAGFKLNNVTDAQIRANITEVEDSFAGIILQGTSDCVVLPGTKITRKSGETTAKGIRSDSGATNTSLIVEGVDLVDIDSTIELATFPTNFKQSNNLGHDFDTWTNSDTTPNVAAFDKFFTGTTGVTVTQFDNGYTGQKIEVISKGATVYDTSTASRLIGSSVDITTASGDITMWICETGGTSSSVWRLMGFVDVSVDNSAGA